jgi:hypothetical protein
MQLKAQKDKNLKQNFHEHKYCEYNHLEYLRFTLFPPGIQVGRLRLKDWSVIAMTTKQLQTYQPLYYVRLLSYVWLGLLSIEFPEPVEIEATDNSAEKPPIQVAYNGNNWNNENE